MNKCDIGLIGLAVMGKNLVLNMADHGYKVAVYNRTTSKVDKFLRDEAEGTNIVGTYSFQELVNNLARPRRIMLMIKAGKPVDLAIDSLIPYLEPGDIIIDGGNSNYQDTIRRVEYVTSKGLHFIGTGISGGEEGARHGPSIMPGGSPEAWPAVKDIFQSIAANVNDLPCCDWVGLGGAGHFVKMVHNGIEYGDMQLIAESYHMMKSILNLSNEQIHEVFAKWDQGKLDSYLIEITKDIMSYKNEAGEAVIDAILDTAGQKGTGRWTAINSLEFGIPLNLITEAVFARSLSALKDERKTASAIFKGNLLPKSIEPEIFINNLEKALYASKIISYAQGYMLMKTASKQFGWELNYGGIAQMWRGGCIIRSAFLDDIKKAYTNNPKLKNLLFDPYFKQEIENAEQALRYIIAYAVSLGIPTPTMSSALAFFDGYRHETLPANLIQAQRDYFGAHTYERVDQPRGEFFHTNWTGTGGDTTSSTYNA